VHRKCARNSGANNCYRPASPASPARGWARPNTQTWPESLVTSILVEVGNALIARVIRPAQALPEPGDRLAATAPLYETFAREEPENVKVWLMWSMHFAPEIQAEYRRFEAQVIDALADMIRAGAASDGPEEDMHDRARIILASSAFLAKMVFDGVSEKRREAFVQHVIQPLLDRD
jgi:hypothetical protein